MLIQESGRRLFNIVYQVLTDSDVRDGWELYKKTDKQSKKEQHVFIAALFI